MECIHVRSGAKGAATQHLVQFLTRVAAASNKQHGSTNSHILANKQAQEMESSRRRSRVAALGVRCRPRSSRAALEGNKEGRRIKIVRTE